MAYSANTDNRKKRNKREGPWNLGRAMGQKRPFSHEDLSAIVAILVREVEERPMAVRDLALLHLGVDTMLRGSDLLNITIFDIYREGEVVTDLDARQKKTRRVVSCMLVPETRDYVNNWIKANWEGVPHPDDKLFDISTRRYRDIVKYWARLIRLDSSRYSTHSIRRTKAKLVFNKTKNLETVRKALGQQSLGATSAYLGVGQEDVRQTLLDINPWKK